METNTTEDLNLCGRLPSYGGSRYQTFSLHPLPLKENSLSDFGSYSGEEFFGLKFNDREYLIDKIMREKDTVMLVGDPKAGKSILIKQLICSLTTGHPFLDEFSVPKARKVTYVQLEGELCDTQDRFNRMIPALDFDKTKFQIIFQGPLKLQEKPFLEALIDEIERFHIPDVVIIDPLYFAAVGGSLSDDHHINKFTGNMRILKDHFNCSLIVVHHTHKMRLDNKGQVVIEGDDATFGSVFLKAWPDHLMLFKFNQSSGIRHLTCMTQRSGTIVKDLDLELNQPLPLYFKKEKVSSDIHDKSQLIFKCLKENPDGLDVSDICKYVHIGHSTFYRDIKGLLKTGVVVKSDTHRPVTYRILSTTSN